VHLQAAAREAHELEVPVHGSHLAGETHRRALDAAQCGGVGFVDVHRIAPCAGEGVGLREHHGVELLAPARRHRERARRQQRFLRLERGEPTPTIDGGELAARTEVPTAPLHLIARGGQALDAGVGGDDLGDLGSQRLVGGPREGGC